MTTVRDLARWLEDFAPTRLAESWDNVGLLWGDPAAPVAKVMTCLTVTPGSAGEAVREGAGLIVSHHPILFWGAKRVVAGQGGDGFLWTLATAGVAVYSPHTAFDNTEGGINDGLAARLGLTDVGPLRAMPASPAFKIVAFTPEADREAVLAAAFGAGAGRIGAYDECSFASEGHGTFFGREGSNPTVGRAGRRESAAELRVEVVCPADVLPAVLAAVRKAHSYEEPAVDVYPLHVEPGGPGAGRVGTLPEATTLGEFARTVANLLRAPGLQYVGDPSARVGRVAVVCGAGDDFVPDARKARADVLLTGEARFHRALEAESGGLGLVVAGHHATERPGVEDLAGRLASAFPGLHAWASRDEHDPLRAVGTGPAGK